MQAYELTLLIYNLTLIPMIFFSVLFLILSLINLSMTERKRRFPKLKTLPFVSIQIPAFNDPIAERCVRQCLKMDYPRNRYEILIVDDSTNKETQQLLKRFAKKHPGFVKYVHRENREGFKPGALNAAMPQTKGDIIVVFDADWIPKKDFLRKIVRPFADPKVAIVQTRQGFYNHRTNLISRFAAYTLMIYHTIVMPINNRINCVFFCGTAGALRRSAFEEVGGWNKASITEDSDLSIKLLLKGYTTVYLEDETPSEVPETFESFIKQQMRWCYGNVRVFIDNMGSILFRKGLSLKQRIMITYITMGHIIAPIVVLMTIFGFSGWFLGEPALFNWFDLVDLITRILLTAGFFVLGFVTLWRHSLLDEFKYLVAGALTIGLVLSVANSVALFKAVFNRNLHWFCTPKVDNAKAL